MVPSCPDLSSASAFRSAIVAAADCRISPLPLAESSAWRLTDGIIRHVTGRFFSVAALPAAGSFPSQPILLQPEIGTLAFLRCVDAGMPLFLAHAKVEPGNIGDAQFAPTCQATRSNLDRAHGGQSPAYAGELAVPATGAAWLASTQQSEQGTRFYGKRNSNAIRAIGSRELDGLPDSPNHAWLPGPVLQALLLTDHAVNTDARSVLVCADWQLITPGRPFEARSGNRLLALGLSTSYAAPTGADEAAEAFRLLASVRAVATPMPAPIPITGLSG